jgi:hypothetical protein
MEAEPLVFWETERREVLNQWTAILADLGYEKILNALETLEDRLDVLDNGGDDEAENEKVDEQAVAPEREMEESTQDKGKGKEVVEDRDGDVEMASIRVERPKEKGKQREEVNEEVNTPSVSLLLHSSTFTSR